MDTRPGDQLLEDDDLCDIAQPVPDLPEANLTEPRPNYHLTPLMHAVQNTNTDIIHSLIYTPPVDFNFLNQRNNNGNTALILAAQNGHTQIVNDLLEARRINYVQNLYEAQRAPYRLNEDDPLGEPPVHQRANRPANPINGGQSVHEVSVHVSVSNSAKNLRDQYAYNPKQIKALIDHLTTYLNSINADALPAGFNPQWLEPAKACVRRITSLNYTDERSNVSIQEALALAWRGINNLQANGPNKPPLKLEEIFNRRINFIKNLYENQRAYNLLEAPPSIEAEDHPRPEYIDNGLDKDAYTCVSGSFNKVIAALSAAGHIGVEVIFVTQNLINLQVPFLTKQAFSCLSSQEREAITTGWEGENSDAIQAAYFNQIKSYVEKRLHETYGEFSEEVPNLAQVLETALSNIHYTDMSEVIKKELEAMQKKEAESVLSANLATMTFSNAGVALTQSPRANNHPETNLQADEDEEMDIYASRTFYTVDAKRPKK